MVNKPPLGIAPCYIWIDKRIDDIADTIVRYVDAGIIFSSQIDLWAREILYLINIKYESMLLFGFNRGTKIRLQRILDLVKGE